MKVLGAVCVAAAFAVAIAVFVLAGGAKEAQPWDEVESLGGQTIRVSYSTGTCNASEELEIEETDVSVTITVVVTIKASSCDDSAVSHELEADLGEPLGDRDLIDGACTYDPPATYGKCG